MGNNRNDFFDQLPSDMKNHIRDFVGDNAKNSELATAALVSKEWSTFFQPKLTDRHFIYFLSNNKDACKELTLEKLMLSLKLYLNHARTEEDRVELFLALQMLEKQIIDIETNPKREQEREQLKIRSKDIQQFLKAQFGLAGLINSFTLLYSLDVNTFNLDSAIPLLVLEQGLKQNPKEYQPTLDLVNLCAKRVGYFIPEGGMGEGLEKSQLTFEDDSLKIVLGPATVYRVADLISFSADIEDLENDAVVNKKINDLIIELKKMSESNPAKKMDR